MKYIFGILIALLLSAPRANASTNERRQFTSSIMLTNEMSAEITVIDTADREAIVRSTIDRALGVLRQVEGTLGSQTGNLRDQLAQLPSSTPLPLTPEMFALFEQAVNLSLFTDGWFDITSPSPKGWFTTRDFRRIHLDPEKRTIAFSTTKMKLDLHWLMQAGAVDLAIASLTRDGITNARVAVGGVSRTMGHDLFTPWSLTVALTAKGNDSHAQRAMRYDLANTAAAIVRSQDVEGLLLDARTRRPVAVRSQSVAVLANNAVTATAFALAAATLGPKAGMHLIEKYSAVKGAIVDNGGHLLASKELATASGNPDAERTIIAPTRDQGPNDLKQKEREEESDR